jgi:glycine/D-amino acid oxidase-like deaminating enzyme
MTEIIAKEGIDCDFWRGFTYGSPPCPYSPLLILITTPDVVISDQTVADDLAAAYQEFVDDGGPVEGIIERILDPEEARKATRCPSAVAAYKTPAGSLWPYKLVAHLLTLCIEKHGLNLQTHTPVRRVLPSTSTGGGGWCVETDRGALQTEKVVYATNGFTATLLPEFVGHIWPFKGQCSAVVPPRAYCGDKMLRETYALVRVCRLILPVSLMEITGVRRLRLLDPASPRRHDYIRRRAEVRTHGATPRKYERQRDVSGNDRSAQGSAAAHLRWVGRGA